MSSEASNRYKTVIANVFSAENKLKLQLKIESSLAQVQAELKIISQEDADAISNAVDKVQLTRVQEIEEEIHHDLMAMVKSLAEEAGEAGEKIHYGATSTDIQDSVLALQMTRGRTLILQKLSELMDLLAEKAENNKNVACIGRTHGQFAVPTTVGFKFANFLFEFMLTEKMIKLVPLDLAKFSGAVGNYASLGRMDVETKLLDQLNLSPCLISTQVVSRVVHSQFLMGLALIAGVLERLSKEIRNLQRSEIGEWLEPFASRQVGSSAMPHKRNPHKSERISGLARIIRANVQVGLENVALEHERDITHSSAERIIIPESANLTYYILDSMCKLISGLQINERRITNNLMQALSNAQSEQILSRLTEVIGRQKGHELLTKHVIADEYKISVLKDQEIIRIIPIEELEKIFSTVEVGLATQKVEMVIQAYKGGEY
ncbi:MAG: adenylosuccinate lyase [Candidatus Heimdallarchaeota archaeon]|nr:adenylosuccinate lyase [Candidatus Heimdallarchaeota archaeon]